MKWPPHNVPLQGVDEVGELLHDLAQPLTALAFLTEMALLQRDPELWRDALVASAAETRRAMSHLRRLQESVAQVPSHHGVV